MTVNYSRKSIVENYISIGGKEYLVNKEIITNSKVKMNKQEITKIREEVASILNRLDNMEKIEKDEEFIKSPIKMEKLCNGLCMPFNENRQILLFDKDYYTYRITYCTICSLVNIKVRKQPTPHNELEVGKWYVSVHSLFDNLSDRVIEKYNFKLYLGDEIFAFVNRDQNIDRGDISNSDIYHEVVEDKEE